MSNEGSPAEKARALMARKDVVELELDTQLSILKANGVTMQTPLVDREGFPRTDIDIWAVRKARVKIIELRNDLTGILDAIGRALESVYDPSLTEIAGSERVSDTLKPFTKVENVAPGSPASEAGLQTGDLLVKFGHLDETSFRNGSLQPVADLVAECENRSITLRVLRAGAVVFLTLVPRKNWGGRGMLGQDDLYSYAISFLIDHDRHSAVSNIAIDLYCNCPYLAWFNFPVGVYPMERNLAWAAVFYTDDRKKLPAIPSRNVLCNVLKTRKVI